MTTTKAVTCDGCGKTVASPGPNYPAGWMRLSVTGRKLGTDRLVPIATVDICHPKCAQPALHEADADIGDPPDA